MSFKTVPLLNEDDDRFVTYYKKYPDKPLMVLLGLYKGQYYKFLISSFFYLIKHSPALFSPLLLANVINGVLEGGEAAVRAIIINVGIWLALLAIHVPANYMHAKYRSRPARRAGSQAFRTLHSLSCADAVGKTAVQDHP